MRLWDWFLGLFSSDGTLKANVCIGDLAIEMLFKELAVQTCINLIANTVTRSEFVTYVRGQEVQKRMYYRLNVEPNQNKNASKFWRDVIYKLVHDNECLIIEHDDMLYVADSFDVDPYALKENVYTNIVIQDLPLYKTFLESDVLYLELHNEKIRTVIEGINRSYEKLIAASQGNYKKNNAPRGTLDIPTNYTQTPKGQQEIDDLFKEKFKRFFGAEGGAVLPLPNGLKYTELSSNIGVKGGADGKDIRGFIDDIIDFTAMGFQIPPQLIKGNIADTEKAVNNFLTFCINPLAELITDEINRKMYGEAAFLEKSYVKLDTSRIRAVDIKDVANALDILLRIGAFCIDDCLKALGKEPLNTEWSRARWMTKNYEKIGKGGEKSGNAKSKNPVGS